MKTTIAITVDTEQVELVKKERKKLDKNFSEMMRIIIDYYFKKK